MNQPETKVLIGDVFAKLAELPDESVHCVVTSPPYWGLRSYLPEDHPLKHLEIGQEKTPQEFIDKMVELFREVRRVLRNDGTLWLNMGDMFNDSGRSGGTRYAEAGLFVHRGATGEPAIKFPGLKRKDLCGMPWRLAFALQNDGWYLRCDIIWAKTNATPESVTDRPARIHEYVFLMSKNARYFFDHEAVKEPVTGSAHPRGNGVNPKAAGQQSRLFVDRTPDKVKRKKPSGWDTSTGNGGHGKFHKDGRRKEKQNPSFSAAVSGTVSMRNRRSVWNIPSSQFSGSHFATFPPGLVKPCILAGTSEKGCCAECGKPYTRGEPDLEHQRACGGNKNGQYLGLATKDFAAAKAQNASATKARILAGMVERKTVGWKKECKCATNEIKRCVVLDPFLGSGTTGEVANQFGRDCLGIDLDERNLEFIRARTAQIGFALP